ncbi:hypothetical protein FUA48_04740 [Flavobacterium alkalisoli]|uniref:Uncharacterized protein n=1 Tax=Flavobacterium alkalisoli TaxID=2602769 RepID=A0A5B9FW64_9FLAO|nr:hypothetical protein [Flavobacterium alkalisoli]QEE48907.1 hypothetical protein FUA48_04740 [Flavobacterium alkalisoli]
MTTLDFTVGEAAITFYNNDWGKETVTYNGKVVSEKTSVFGTRHEFTVDEDTYELITSLVINSTIGLKTQLRKNGRLQEEKTTGQSLLHLVIGIAALAILIEVFRSLF